MNTKARLLIIAMAMLVLTGNLFGAAQLSIPSGGKYDFIAPNPIPLNSTTTPGSPGVGVLKIDLEAAVDLYIGQIVVTRRTAGLDPLSISWMDYTNTKVYLNTSNKYEATNPPFPENNLGAITLAAGSVTTAGDNITINISDAAAQITTAVDKTLWIAFDYPASLWNVTPKDVNYYISTIDTGPAAGGTEHDAFAPLNDPDTTVKIIDYHTTFVATGLVDTSGTDPDKYDQGKTDLEVLQLAFGHATNDEDLSGIPTWKQIYTLKLEYTGESALDVTPAGVSLYKDHPTLGTIGTFDDGIDILLDSDTVGGSPLGVSFGPWIDSEQTVQFAQGPAYYLVVVNISTTATPGHKIGFQVIDPSQDIVFATVPSGIIGAHVDNGAIDAERYNQKAYVTDAAAEPTTLHEFTITEYVPPDITPPVVSTNLPTGSSESRSTNVTIVFSENMDEDKLPPILGSNITFRTDPGGAEVSFTPTYNDVTNTLVLNPDSDLAFNTTYRVTVKGAIPSAGTTADESAIVMANDFSWTFTTEPRTPPTVEDPTPDNGATLVPLNQVISVTFSEPVKNVNASTFTVNGGAVGGTITHTDGQQSATFDPTDDLAFDTLYTVNLSTGITDMEDSAMASDYSWSFRTKLRTPPTVASTVPDNNAPSVSRSDDFTVTFSEAVWGFTTSDFTLTTGGTPVAGCVVTFSDGDQTATITHPNLTFGATYIATVGTGIVDGEGTAMAAAYSWTFTVATVVPPSVVAVTPENGALGVSPQTTVTATFSKSIDPDTIETDAGADTFQVYLDANRNGVYDALVDTTRVTGDVEYTESTTSATFTPDATLPYAYFVVRLTTGIEDTNGIAMAAEYSTWGFSTNLAVSEPTAASNRIQPGVNDRTIIFIPEPPASAGGANARVTVQVFTPTGRRVATLVSARRYSDLLADLPLLWYGVNGQGDRLGPGLYFIRISAAKWVRTLKVLIVR